MPRLRLGAPLWLVGAPARRPLRYRPLDRDLVVDIVIVGGGITGAAIACKFAAENVRVAVLEAGRVARGSTAANTALLMQEPDKDLQRSVSPVVCVREASMMSGDPNWQRQLVTLFVLALPIASIAWTVTHEEVFKEPREWCAARSQSCRRLAARKFFYLFTCEHCWPTST